jgi:CDP-glycerol glycerophosphotransferase (TagB/SpsB family)
MLALAKSRPDIQIILRPHPFLWGTLVDRNVLSEAELQSWRQDWESLPNTATSEGGSYGELFLATDALVTDGISFLGEFPLVTGKPSIFFEKQDHWEFSPIGEIAAACSVRVQNFQQLEAVLDQTVKSGLPNLKSEIDRLVAESSPQPGNAAKLILDQVVKDFSGPDGPSRLVEPTLIMQTPWELVPGREPFED